MPETDVADLLDRARRELLDLSLVNPLLNYRLLKARGVDCVGERAAEVFARLVAEGGRFGFLDDPKLTAAERARDRRRPSDDEEDENDLEEAPEPTESSTSESAQEGAAAPARDATPPPALGLFVEAPSEPGSRVRVDIVDGVDAPVQDVHSVHAVHSVHSTPPPAPATPDPTPDPTPEPAARRSRRERALLTPFGEKELRARLLKTLGDARTFVEERGANPLRLALGMLEWRESPSSERSLFAPLLLVPVDLSRANVSDSFHLAASGEDPEGNVALLEKLRADFSIAHPMPEFEDDFDPTGYLELCATTYASRPGWRVHPDRIALGLFSFGKFLMFKDLENTGTPPVAERPLIRRLLADGFSEPASAIGDDDPVDPHTPPARMRTVLDADSSQTLAVLDAMAGRNLVIQGPPGTGKSQTIANLIAESLGAGRRVLFVAEKMAALEVVKRRLDAIGLGDACLEVHGHKTRKQDVLAELRRTLSQGAPVAREDAIRSDHARLEIARDRLNEYCEAVNAPVGDTGTSPRRAFGELLRLEEARARISEWKRFAIVPPDTTGADAERRSRLLAELASHLATMGVPKEHPFRGMRAKALPPAARLELETALREAIRSLEGLAAAHATLAAALSLAAPSDRVEADRALATAERLLAAPDLAGFEVASGRRPEASPIRALLAAGESYAALRSRLDPHLLPEAYDAELLGEREAIRRLGGKWWRFLSGDWRRAKARVASLHRGDPPRDSSELLARVEGAIEARRLRATIREGEATGRATIGTGWHGEATDWPRARVGAEFLLTAHDDLAAGRLSGPFFDLLARAVREPGGAARLGPLKTALQDARAAEARAAGDFASVVRILEIDEAVARIDSWTPGRLARLREMSESLPRVREMIGYRHLRDALAAEGLEGLGRLADEWPDAPRLLVDVWRAAWNLAVLDRAYAERPCLRAFDGETHARGIDEFRELDRMALRHARALLARRHHESLPAESGAGHMGVLLREFQKKRAHLPIRRLMERAGLAVQAIKPVFMMSPLSIASFLPRDVIDFDLAIFDEASQVRPVDAFGAVLRVGQVVVVGDDKQLPPTDFFSSSGGASEEEDDAGEAAGDLESVLGLMLAKGAPRRMLRWHYRSRHESLIAVSNAEFYENRLLVFPSPDREGATGVRFRHLPATAYDRGRARVNRGEAREVALAAMRHARETPHLTLGIAAFSMAQRDAIEDELETLRGADPSCEGFFAAHPHEPFFVKNLETVQGDERDSILVSVGYGKDANGRISMNFGPLNRDGGERRLNVLVTRARLRCKVFANFTDEDIDASARAVGVRALRRYLRFARTGELDRSAPTFAEADSPFELEVMETIRSLGYEADPQVGCAGYRIDLGVKAPGRPGRYVLGVECDGASYHSARSARDRDRLRQQVLEGLGWRMHRVWSTDWFEDPARETKRLAEALEAACAATAVAECEVPPADASSLDSSPPVTSPAASSPNASSSVIAPVVEREPTLERTEAPARESAAPADASPRPSRATRPYRVASPPPEMLPKNIDAATPESVARLAARIVEEEEPVHLDEAMRRLLGLHGVSRLGAQIERRFRAGIDLAARRGQVIVRGDFLWREPRPRVPPRDRSALPPASRKIEWIAEEELEGAIEEACRALHGPSEAELLRAALEALGWRRAGADSIERAGATLRTMADRGDLTIVAGVVRPATRR